VVTLKGVLAPRTLLGIFGEPPDRDMWIRRRAESIRLP
jgi:hypothetical protein